MMMKAVILAGGKGTRLMPLTKDIPKPMVTIAGKPLLEWQILLLKKYGIIDIILCTNYLHEVIERYFGDGQKWGVRIQHSVEMQELGTAGAVKLAEPLIGTDDFFVIFGDDMISHNLLQMAKYHTKHNAEATLLVHESSHPMDSDIIERDKTGRITRIFRPKQGDSFEPINLTCIYILKPSLLKNIELKFCDFGKEIFPKLIAKGHHLQAYYSEEYAQDVGTLERLQKVENDIKEGYIFGLPNSRGDYL
jgi:NDP-sugar pyrophosphorylase family protein